MILLLFAIVHSFFCGMNDSILWGRKGADSFSWNEHLILLFNRYSWIVVLFIQFTLLDIVSSILMVMALHPGFYYQGRKWLDNRYIGFFDNPDITSTAKINLLLWHRIIIFTLSIAIQIWQLLQ